MLIGFSLLQNSCSTSQSKIKYVEEQKSKERKIINAFLEFELASKPYKIHEKDSIIIISNALSKKQVIEDYEAILPNYKNSIFGSIQIRKIKMSLENEVLYNWKKEDFKNSKIILKSREDFRKLVNNEEYLNSPRKIVFHLSTPYFINKKEILLSYISGSSELGFNLINSNVILMIENNDGKWIIEKYLGSRYY